MPKQQVLIENFSGGLVDDPTGRNLNPGEFQRADDVDLGKEGSIKVLGSMETITSPDWSSKITQVTTIEPGYGLYTFESDFGSTGNLSPTAYTVIAGKDGSNNKVVEVLNESGVAISTTSGVAYLTIATGDTTPFYPVVFAVDNTLYIGDGNLDTTKTTNQTLSYIQQTRWEGTTYEETLGKWYVSAFGTTSPTSSITISNTLIQTASSNGSTSNLLMTTSLDYYSALAFPSPATNLLALHVGSSEVARVLTRTGSTALVTDDLSGGNDWASAGVVMFGNTAGDVILNWLLYGDTELTNDGTYLSATYDMAFTNLYTDGRESNPGESTFSIALTNNTKTAPYKLGFNLMVTGPIDPDIKGMRLYGRVADEDDWSYVATFDFKTGGYVSLTNSDPGGFTTYTPTRASTNISTALQYLRVFVTSYGLQPDTFNSLTGITDINVERIGKYKTAVVTNRTAYYGNVKHDGTVYGDAIFKSIPNSFDTIIPENRLEAVKGDGQSIVKLEEYADRILEFKGRNLNIINIAQGIEFLEGQYDYLGVATPAQVVRTDFGVVWANTKGCYVFDGNRIVDLLLDNRDPSKRKISLANWNAFLTAKPVLGYDPLDKKILVTAGSTGAAAQDMLIYEIEDGLWTKGIAKLGSTAATHTLTNWDVNSSNQAIILDGQDLNIERWNSSSTTSTTSLYLETGDLDFGLPGTKKSIYTLYIRHKNSDGNVRVRYRVDGTSDLLAFSPPVLPDASTFVVTEMTVASSTASRNVDSFGVVIDSSAAVGSDFEIDGIQIIYRVLGVR